MAHLTAVQKAVCECVLKAWTERGSDRYGLRLAHTPDLFEAKQAIAHFVVLAPRAWLPRIVQRETNQHGWLVPGYSQRWPADYRRDGGFTCVPPVPERLLSWDDVAESRVQ